MVSTIQNTTFFFLVLNNKNGIKKKGSKTTVWLILDLMLLRFVRTSEWLEYALLFRTVIESVSVTMSSSDGSWKWFLSLTVGQLAAEHHGFGVGDVDAVHQGLQAQVEVDECRLDADLGHAQPQTHILRAVLHEQSHHVALPEATLQQQVGHAVWVLVQLPEAPPLTRALKDQRRLVSVLLYRLGEDLGDGVTLAQVSLHVQLHFQQHHGRTAENTTPVGLHLHIQQNTKH